MPGSPLSSRRPESRPQTTTAAPSAISARAIARPIPMLPPVMNARLPVSPRSMARCSSFPAVSARPRRQCKPGSIIPSRPTASSAIQEPVTELRMRPYADEDLPRLLDTVAGWISEAGRCGYDHIGELPHRIYENLRGRRPVGDLVRLWEAGGAGVEINLRFGVAFDVFAAPALRGSEAERS